VVAVVVQADMATGALVGLVAAVVRHKILEPQILVAVVVVRKVLEALLEEMVVLGL